MWEEAKKRIEKITGLGRPGKAALKNLVRPVAPKLYYFADDGETPNNPACALILYRGAIVRPRHLDPAAIFEDLFAANGWKESWRDGIYPFLHFHTKTHEVLGCARGRVRIQFGGKRGRAFSLRAGDVAVLPAGTGHRRLTQSADLLVVGAYPATGSYDEPRPSQVDHAKAVSSIAKVRPPARDPVYGAAAPLNEHWRVRAT